MKNADGLDAIDPSLGAEGREAGEMVLKIDLESPGFGFLDEIFSAENLPKIEGKPQ
jgi:hypothetical protein